MLKIIEKIKNKIGAETSRQLLKFTLIGLLNAAVNYFSYLFFLHLFSFYLLAFVGSHIITVLHSYFWNRLWTFKHQGNHLKEIGKFFLIYLFSFILNLILLPLMVEVFHIQAGPAQLIPLFLITALSFTFNFLGLKFWAFKG
jgi:putative flippase GtrA